MKRGDYIGLIVCVGYGLWMLLLPNSVLKFYKWFHRGRGSLPKQSVVRVVGAL